MIGLATVVAVVAGCDLLPGGVDLPGAGSSSSSGELITVGERREEVTTRLGEPEERWEWVKQDEGGVFGPIESFWSEVPVGATVEIWRFPTEGGTVEAYFVDGSPTVLGTAFDPEGAIY